MSKFRVLAATFCLVLIFLPLERADAASRLYFPQGDDTYDLEYGYPYFGAAGDTVHGARSTPELPSTNYIALNVKVDAYNPYFCTAYLLFYYDEVYLGYATIFPGGGEWTINGELTLSAEDVRNSTEHDLYIELYSDLWENCAEWLEMNVIESYFDVDLVGADQDGDGAFSPTYYGDDCNDADPSMYPGNQESCDSKDNDCDGQFDEEAGVNYYPDSDHDGYGDSAAGVLACTAPSDYVAQGGDCDDDDEGINPDEAERCDGLDNDCDGSIDEQVLLEFYLDGDQDGWGDDDETILACEAPADYVDRGEDCNDDDATINPDASELCDGQDNDCNASVDEGLTLLVYVDVDGDGYGTGSASEVCTIEGNTSLLSGDCDDGNAEVNPGSTERCNNQDDNCDGVIDESVQTIFYQDSDGDGYGSGITTEGCTQPDGYVTQAGDCDDDDAMSNPGAEEQCDGSDNDCDAQSDEGVLNSYYLDLDGDGSGVEEGAVEGCVRPEGYALSLGDCDDADDSVYPQASELCDEKDNDCDDVLDEGVLNIVYADSDHDTWGDESSTLDSCQPVDGYVSRPGDCDDQVATTYPEASEFCDGIDNDCDSNIDEGVQTTYYADSDGDLYGDPSQPSLACDLPEGFATQGGDCDDEADDIFPGAAESCDLEDDDCDGGVDEGVLTSFYQDLDGDTYGNDAISNQACSPSPGYIVQGGDCDDSSDLAYPGAEEDCDGADTDCDGQIDEGAQSNYYLDGDGDDFGTADSIQGCSLPDGYAPNSGDCDDSDGGIYPGAEEQCNSRDEDCDGLVDEGALLTAYADEDGDGYGDATEAFLVCEIESGLVLDDSDCDDLDAQINSQSSELCDAIDNDCDSVVDEGLKNSYYLDADGDGYGSPGNMQSSCEIQSGYVENDEDCNDSAADVNPEGNELCDGADQDCDFAIDEGALSTFYADGDLDTFGDDEQSINACYRPSGYSNVGGDCDDEEFETNPNGNEVCDSIDQDCDELIDEGTLDVFFLDEDGDGYGASDSGQAMCEAPEGSVDNDEDCNDLDPGINPESVDVCGDGLDQDCNGYDLQCGDLDADSDGYSPQEGDCDDADSSIYPDAEELCDEIDNDCNGIVDDRDQDGDGELSEDCGGLDCDDDDSEVNSSSPEVCADGQDNDCSGIADDLDADQDGGLALSCGGDDCDDEDPRVNAGAEDVCDGLDNNCSGFVDDLDQDDDGYISALCGGADCDDLDPDINPDAEDGEDGIDNDCDGSVDGGTGAADDDGDGFTENGGDCNDSDDQIYPGAEEIPDDGVDNNCNEQIDEYVESTPTQTPLQATESESLTPSNQLTEVEGTNTPSDETEGSPSPWEETELYNTTPQSQSPTISIAPTPTLQEQASPSFSETASLAPDATLVVQTPTPGEGSDAGCECDTSAASGPVGLFYALLMGALCLRRRRFSL